MITPEQIRSIALALPESDEHEHWGKPSYRTRKRIFATVHPDENRAVLKLPLEDQEAVTTLQPNIFSLAGWSHQGWTNVDLTVVDSAEFKSLLILAWRTIATKRAIKAWDNQSLPE